MITRSRFPRRAIIVVSALLAAVTGSVTTHAQVPQADGPRPEVCDDPTNSLSLFAENMGGGRIGYGRVPGKASVPGPTLTMNEGECLQVTLVNDSDKRLSMHAHGVAYTPSSDGTPTNAGCVAPGRAKTYVFEAPAPSTRPDGTVDPGSAGYWHYHDHCMGTTHGTGGIRKGLYGALIVRRAGDPLPDRKPIVLVMNNISFNNKTAPHTPLPQVNQGERIEFVVIGHGELMHTFHLHAHRWVDNRTGLAATVRDTDRIIDNRTVGPADSFGFQIIAGEHVGPGAWMYHCHVQGHSDLGMEGLFIVRTPGGELTRETKAAIRRYKNQHEGGHP